MFPHYLSMKKQSFIFLIFLSLALLPACTVSKENKAKQVARTAMNQILVDFESYQPVKTTVDSAFVSVYTDPVITKAAHELTDLAAKRKDVDADYDFARQSVSIWQDHWDAYSREQHNQAIGELNEFRSQLNDIDKDMAEQKEIIRNRAKEIKEGAFYGWTIHHRFRCKTADGETLTLNDAIIVADSLMENIYGVFIVEGDDKYEFDKLKRIIDNVLDR